MKDYKTIGVVSLFGGVVGLSSEQAESRPNAVKKLKSGEYEVIAPVQFKAGEIIGLDNVGKTTLALLEDLQKPRQKKEA